MRVAFIVDGFNLYHSIKAAEKAVATRPLKWLDIAALCGSYVKHFGRSARLGGVHYFSALARHLEAHNPEVVGRHEAYIAALRSTGVEVTLASFKRKDQYIPFTQCQFRVWPFRRPLRLPFPRATVISQRYEEKETDVAITAKMFELMHTGAADAVVLVTGDTDVLPAIRTAQRLFPSMPLCVCFPFRRFNRELSLAVPQSFKVKAQQYARYQLPDPVVLADGTTVAKPPKW